MKEEELSLTYIKGEYFCLKKVLVIEIKEELRGLGTGVCGLTIRVSRENIKSHSPYSAHTLPVISNGRLAGEILKRLEVYRQKR